MQNISFASFPLSLVRYSIVETVSLQMCYMCLEKETFDKTQTVLLTLLTIKATYSGPLKIEALQS